MLRNLLHFLDAQEDFTHRDELIGKLLPSLSMIF